MHSRFFLNIFAGLLVLLCLLMLVLIGGQAAPDSLPDQTTANQVDTIDNQEGAAIQISPVSDTLLETQHRG